LAFAWVRLWQQSGGKLGSAGGAIKAIKQALRPAMGFRHLMRRTTSASSDFLSFVHAHRQNSTGQAERT
jgi:hypothetical protein